MTTRRGLTLAEALIVIALIAVLLAITDEYVFFQIAGHMGSGWFAYPLRNLDRFTIEWTSVSVAVVAFVAFTFGLHPLLSRWWTKSSGSPTRWRWRKSLAIEAAILFACVAGTSMIGIIHQGVWMATSGEKLVVTRFVEADHRTITRAPRSQNHLKQIGLSFHNYHDRFRAFPPGATLDKSGRPCHSWQLMILPYVDRRDLFDRVVRDSSWNAPENKESFSTVVELYLNPGLGSEDRVKRNSDGYALSHYSGNIQVLQAGNPLQIRDVRDGFATTILAGEVGEGFKPWGDPMNLRDPALGLKVSLDTFGSSDTDTTNLLMVDGSVRSVSPQIDPSILRALATPDGGEPAPVDWDRREGGRR